MALKFNRTDKSILLFSLAIVIVFSFFLYDDSFLFQNRESKNAKIGTIKTAENDVRLRASDSFTWNSAKKAEVVFERDSVFTGKRSQTQITLVDGSKIFLNENSLVTLIAKNGKLELNLRYGYIKTEISPTSKLELKSGAQKIILNKVPLASTLEIKKPKFGLTKIKLLAGELTVTHSTQSTPQNLVRDQSVVIKPTGVMQKTNPGTLSLITPDNTEFYKNANDDGYYLDWHGQNMEKISLVVGVDKSFKSVAVTVPNIKTKVHIKNLPIGTYFWKVTGTDLNSMPVESEIRSFKIELLEKISIVDPPNNKKWNIETKGDIATHQEPVKISWTNSYDIVQAQIANTSDFKNPIYDQELTKKFNIEKNLNAGTFFARVRGKKLDRYSEWSDIRSFEISVTSKSLIKPVVPVLITKKLTFNSAKGRAPSSVSPVTVKWQPALSAVRYEVELSLKDPNFSRPTKLATKNTQIDFLPKNLGTHYYRVRGISSDNLASNFSETGELYTKLAPPKLAKVESIIRRSNDPNSVAPTVQFKLDWNAVHLASKYLIEVSDEATFTNPDVKTSLTNAIEVAAPKTGSYFFRVIASDSSQTIKSEFSNVESSNYNYIKRLAKPILTEPKNNMTVFLQKEIEPFIWLNWDSAVDKKQFELEIALDKGFSKIIIRRKLDENRFLIKDKLPLGKVYWRVRQLAEDPNLISDWTDTRVFQLIHNKNEGVFK